MRKALRPEWSTVVLPSEYDIDGQMESWLHLANSSRSFSMDIDVGKFWGLFTSWREARTLLHTLALGVSLGDKCPFCGDRRTHKEHCGLDKWAEENTIYKS